MARTNETRKGKTNKIVSKISESQSVHKLLDIANNIPRYIAHSAKPAKVDTKVQNIMLTKCLEDTAVEQRRQVQYTIAKSNTIIKAVQEENYETTHCITSCSTLVTVINYVPPNQYPISKIDAHFWSCQIIQVS